jgi:lipid II:glycine glycyltransferase (peptidoglycan interpeptide bridge formation enzyme)
MMNRALAQTPEPPPGELWQTSLEPLGSGKWSALLAEFADANFYQTHAYGSVSWGEGSLTHLVVRQQEHVRALAQVRQIRLGRWFGVAYVRWGPCARRRGAAWDAAAFRRALAALGEEFVQCRGWVLRVVPNLFRQDSEATIALQTLQALGFERDEVGPAYRTFRVDLTPPLETIRKRLDGKWRNQLNAAIRSGLEIREGNDRQLFREFRALYDEMMARKRFETTVDVADFERMQERLAPGEQLRVALAAGSGRYHAGLVATALGETGIYLLGATGEEGLKSKASYLLQWQMMDNLKSAGWQFYDLGGINPATNPGVYHFKSGMGGEEVVQLGRFERAPSASRRKLLHWAERFQRLWRRWRVRARP